MLSIYIVLSATTLYVKIANITEHNIKIVYFMYSLYLLLIIYLSLYIHIYIKFIIILLNLK